MPRQRILLTYDRCEHMRLTRAHDVFRSHALSRLLHHGMRLRMLTKAATNSCSTTSDSSYINGP